MNYSPLFWPISYDQGIIKVLDETLLPHQEQYLSVNDCEQACQIIKQMKTRAVGQVILTMYVFLLVYEKNKTNPDLIRVLEQTAASLVATRPTLSFKHLTDMVLGWAKTKIPLDQAILGFLSGLKQKRIDQAKQTVLSLADNDTVLTHCNISGQMSLIAELAKQANKKIKFFVTETRPYLQGSRLTAWELQRAGFSVTVICDNMVAQVMSEGKISKVIVGADHLAQNGDIANKIGTFQIAILAKHFSIPFIVICPPASKTLTGKDIKIEVRPENELLEFNGVRIAPQGVAGYYPGFDVTPNELIAKHIHLNI